MVGSERPESGMEPRRSKSRTAFRVLASCLPHSVASGRPHKNIRRNQPTEGHVELTGQTQSRFQRDPDQFK